MEWYENIAGIDPVTALKYCGSKDDIKGVFKIFYDSLDKRISDISDSYKAGDWESYTTAVHSLKSTSKLVGAVKLSEDAKTLEDAGNEKNTDLIGKRTDALLSELESLKETLKPLFSNEPDKADLVPVDTENCQKLLTEMKEAMSDFDLDRADDIIRKLSFYDYPGDLKKLMDSLRSAVANVDDDIATDIANKMIVILQGM